MAVSDSPAGPYRFVSSSRVCPGVFPLNMTDEERDIQWNMEQFEDGGRLSGERLSIRGCL